MAKSNTALATKEEASVPQTHQAPGPASDVIKSDVLIPMLLLMQGQSEYVKAKVASDGDIVRSTTGQKLGDSKTPVEFIPIALKNMWIISELVGKRFEFRKMIARKSIVTAQDVAEEQARALPDKQDESLPWEFAHMGTTWKRVKLLNVFALLAKDIADYQAEIKRALAAGDMPDLDKTLMPVVIPFRSTSFPAGRTVVTHFTKAQAMAQYGAKAHGFALPLTCYADKNDDGDFHVYEVGKSRKASKEEFAEAEKWAAMLGQTTVNVHTGGDAASGDEGKTEF